MIAIAVGFQGRHAFRNLLAFGPFNPTYECFFTTRINAMKYRRCIIPGATYFFTLVTYNRMRILAEKKEVTLLREAFRYLMDRHPFQMDACVILPDHLHAIWTLPEGDHDYSMRWRLIKSYFTHRAHEMSGVLTESRVGKHEMALWQRRFWEHCIRDDADFENHLHYIHYNPVKHGLVGSPGEWPYSSFKHWVQNGVYTADWGSGEMQFSINEGCE